MIKIVSYKYFALGAVIFLLSKLIAGDIPNFALRLWLYSGIFSFITLLIYTRNLRYSFDADKTELYKGDILKLRYKVSNISRILPASKVMISVKPDKRFEQNEIEEFVYIPASDYHTIKREFTARRRGFYNIGQMVIRARDILGIFEITKNFDESISVTIYPALNKAAVTDSASSDYFGSSSIKSMISHDYTNINKIRKYILGDSHKSVNYKVSAKLMELYVNEFDSSARKHIIIFLDGGETSYSVDEGHVLEDLLVETAAYAAKQALMEKIPVLYMDSGSQFNYIDSLEISGFREILNALTGFCADGAASLDEIIHEEAMGFSYKSSIIIFTPFLDEKKTASFISLKNRGFVIYPVIADRTTFSIKYADILKRQGIECIRI